MLGLLLVIVLGAFAYTRWGRPEMALVAKGLSGDGETAREALPAAFELASKWQEDALLVAVSGQRLSVRVQRGEAFSWAFQFFSPATGRLALITVTDGRARLLRDVQAPSKLDTFSVADWNVDSDEALRVWWDNGGEAMVSRHPEAMLAMQLRVSDPSWAPDGKGGDLVWRVSGLVAASDKEGSVAEETLTVVVDAASGALVE